MSNCKLRYVRQNQTVRVFTQHSDLIHPRDLSRILSDRFGKEKFGVSLRKNIYIIYIDRRAFENDDVSTVRILEGVTDGGMQNQEKLSQSGKELREFEIEPKTHRQRLDDFKSAEKILCDTRLPDLQTNLRNAKGKHEKNW